MRDDAHWLITITGRRRDLECISAEVLSTICLKEGPPAQAELRIADVPDGLSLGDRARTVRGSAVSLVGQLNGLGVLRWRGELSTETQSLCASSADLLEEDEVRRAILEDGRPYPAPERASPPERGMSRDA